MISGSVKFTDNTKKIINVMSKTQTEGLVEIGERGVEILKFNTPVKDGRLRNSMSYTIDGKSIDPLGANNPADKLRKINDDKNVVIGTNVIYGPKVEYMATNGSAGYMLRSYKQLKQVAEQIIRTVFKKRGF